ncbi:MAG: single-stranded DNA-binding protein [Leptolyngbyaceae cyanobacterium SU_3_3]|nr:single-stranded DNA-binding protein [Leptolyngbyaceae cyanobacterium SU_3_3]
MNNCILMAEIIQEPQLRYTPDNQTPIAEMRVKFAGLRPDEPPATLKVVGWGNMAQEIQANYHEGDRVILEGRLTINSIDRPEGFKEKMAEMTVQRIHTLNGGDIGASFSGVEASTKSTTVSPTAAPPVSVSAPAATAKPKAAKSAAASCPRRST